MTEKLAPARVTSRMSLFLFHPLMSVAISVTLVAAFLAVSIGANFSRSHTDSQRQTEMIARMVASDVAAGDMAGVERVFEAAGQDALALVSPEGRHLAGEPELLDRGRTLFAPVIHDGREIAKLHSHELSAFRMQTPVWLVALICVSAILVAAVFGYLYSQRLVRDIAAIEQDIDRVAHQARDPGREFGSFAELQRLRLHTVRTLRSLLRERDDLRSLAYHHPVTGLPNLAALQEYVERILPEADEHSSVCFMFINLDRFGRACEMLGAGPGNALLAKAAERMKAELAKISGQGLIHVEETRLAHLHSDDFGVVLSGLSSRKDASLVARAMRAAFVKPFNLDGRRITLGLSGGIVMAPEDGDRAEDLMRRGRIALSSLRDEGRTGFRFFTPRLDRVAKGRLELETDMRRALARDEFEPFFQPKIDFRTGRVSGCEALARWTRKDGGSVSPGAFIPVAEESGLIDEIGQRILYRSCEAAVGWLREGLAIPVAVNVSPSQVARSDFRDQVIGTLAQTGLPPKFLELEITESVAVSDQKKFENVMHPLKAMGVRLAIDDFGTGHSNLSILSRLNFDVFKIDRQFIAGLDGHDSAPAIVEMILAMGESLGLETVAEGIETPEQARFLRRRGCTLGQGFLYARALCESEFREFAESWNHRRPGPRRARAG